MSWKILEKTLSQEHFSAFGQCQLNWSMSDSVCTAIIALSVLLLF